MFLFTSSKNATNHTVQECFRHSGEIVSRHFRFVLEAINFMFWMIICTNYELVASDRSYNQAKTILSKNCSLQ